MTDQPEAPALRTRVVGILRPCTDSAIVIAHQYKPEDAAQSRDESLGPDVSDPGLVHLYVEHGDNSLTVELDLGEALELANRLTRAANLVYETWEHLPDMDREAARLTRAAKQGL